MQIDAPAMASALIALSTIEPIFAKKGSRASLAKQNIDFASDVVLTPGQTRIAIIAMRRYRIPASPGHISAHHQIPNFIFDEKMDICMSAQKASETAESDG